MSSRSVQIIGGANREQAFVDPIHNGIAIVRDRHKKTHEGLLFANFFTFRDIARDETVFIQVSSGPIPVHTRFTISASGATLFRLFEDDTVVNPTALAVAANRNRLVGGSQLSPVSFDRGTARAATGSLLTEGYYPGGSGAPVSGGPVATFEEEWIFQPSLSYVFEVENLSNLDGTIASILLNFYESDTPQTP